MAEQIYMVWSRQVLEELSAFKQPNAAERAAWLKKLAAIKTRSDWQRGEKINATNVEKYNLGCNEDGEPQYKITMDIEGQREHHRTVKLPGSDPQYLDDVLDVLADDIEDDGDTFLETLSKATGSLKLSIICDAETMHLNKDQRERLSPMLWEFVLEYRDSTRADVLVAVGSAIRICGDVKRRPNG